MTAAKACASRTFDVRGRQDLIVSEQWQRGERVFVVKDPLALKYYRFSAREYAVLQWLDRPSSIDELLQHQIANSPKLRSMSTRSNHS